jgi:hypothetical protein
MCLQLAPGPEYLLSPPPEYLASTSIIGLVAGPSRLPPLRQSPLPNDFLSDRSEGPSGLTIVVPARRTVTPEAPDDGDDSIYESHKDSPFFLFIPFYTSTRLICSTYTSILSRATTELPPVLL